jgi:nucleoside-diphosphate-sugar epimerase
VSEYSGFNTNCEFDAIINFVGVGDPAKAASMGAAIFEVTMRYDDLALQYVRDHPQCKYLFLSSGAAYGGDFERPADANTKAQIPINALRPTDWYGVAKLYAECRHRSLPQSAIVDLRVFNYFSATQNMEASFLICDILRAIRDKSVLQTSADNIVRDYIARADFHQLVECILSGEFANLAIDCYSKGVVDKMTLLQTMSQKYGLRYEFVASSNPVNATGFKPHYYSNFGKSKEIGYLPTLDSLGCVLKEFEIYFYHTQALHDQ